MNESEPFEAEIPGVVQAVLEPPLPLQPGDRIVVSGKPQAVIMLLVRTRMDRRAVEFEFENLNLGSAGEVSGTVKARDEGPLLELRRGDGTVIPPTRINEIS